MSEAEAETPIQGTSISMRRGRLNPVLRDMLADTSVSANDLMYPVFVKPGSGIKNPILSMPGVFQFSPDTLVEHLKEVEQLGVRSYMLFGVIPQEEKSVGGDHILRDDSIVAQSLHALKDAGNSMLAAVDVCFCEYTNHGHCGIPHHQHAVDNDATLPRLGEQAVALARAGADLIAPSGMMDGGVGAIRQALDASEYAGTPIMGYSVKYASHFYGPFRDAAESAPSHGDRRQYQQDYRRDTREALEEAARDVEEGADIIMVKPGMPYLDVIAALRENFTQPVAAYQVSGEYAMWKAASANGWIDESAVLRESLISFKRAGASIILTYAAPDACKLMGTRGYL